MYHEQLRLQEKADPSISLDNGIRLEDSNKNSPESSEAEEEEEIEEFLMNQDISMVAPEEKVVEKANEKDVERQLSAEEEKR